MAPTATASSFYSTPTMMQPFQTMEVDLPIEGLDNLIGQLVDFSKTPDCMPTMPSNRISAHRPSLVEISAFLEAVNDYTTSSSSTMTTTTNTTTTTTTAPTTSTSTSNSTSSMFTPMLVKKQPMLSAKKDNKARLETIRESPPSPSPPTTPKYSVVTPSSVPSSPSKNAIHKCNTCDKIFLCQSKLDRHNLTHTGIKPHKCYCGQAFSQKSSLKTHSKRHARDRVRDGKGNASTLINGFTIQSLLNPKKRNNMSGAGKSSSKSLSSFSKIRKSSAKLNMTTSFCNSLLATST